MKLTTLAAAAALSLAAVAASPAAAAVSGVTYVTITSASSNYLQVAELIASQVGTGVDVALAANGARATATSTYSGDPSIDGPANAIDGVFPRGYYETPGIYHGASPSGSDLLTVTFNGAYDLSSVTLYGRTDCCSARDSFTVSAYGANNALLATTTVDGSNANGGGTTAELNGVSAAPEPGAWALMIAGVGLAGFALRRRERGLLAA